MEITNRDQSIRFTVEDLPKPEVLFKGKTITVTSTRLWEIYYLSHRYKQKPLRSTLKKIKAKVKAMYWHIPGVSDIPYDQARVIMGAALYDKIMGDSGTIVSIGSDVPSIVPSVARASTLLEWDPAEAERMVKDLDPADGTISTGALIMAMRPRLHRPEVLEGKSSDWLWKYTNYLLLWSDDITAALAIYLKLAETQPLDAMYVPDQSDYESLITNDHCRVVIELLKIFTLNDTVLLKLGISLLIAGIIYLPAIVVYDNPWSNDELITTFLDQVHHPDMAKQLYRNILCDFFARQEIRALVIKRAVANWGFLTRQALAELMGPDADFLHDPSTWTEKTVRVLGRTTAIVWPPVLKRCYNDMVDTDE